MSKWSEGAELLQKLITAKEVIPVQKELIELQQIVFSLQADQMKLVDENCRLKVENEDLKKKAEYVYAEGHTWLVHPTRPDIRLCSRCLNLNGYENPLDGQWCATCKKAFN